MPKLQESCNENAATWRPSFVTVRHKETLGGKIESAHYCKTDQKSYKFERSSRNCTDSLPSSASASAPLGFVRSMRDDFIGQTLSHDVSREKLPGWNSRRADRGLGCGENGTICLHSNVILIGEEDTTKRKKVTITSSKKEEKETEKQRKQTKESSGPSYQPTSRWVPQ